MQSDRKTENVSGYDCNPSSLSRERDDASMTPVCRVDTNAEPPDDLCKRPPMCCLYGQVHDDPSDLGGNVSTH